MSIRRSLTEQSVPHAKRASVAQAAAAAAAPTPAPAPSDEIQRQLRASMELDQDEVDHINSRLLECISAGFTSIPMYRVMVNPAAVQCVVVKDVDEFCDSYERVQRCQAEVITNEQFSNVMAAHRTEHLYTMGMLAHFQRSELCWVITRSCWVLTPFAAPVSVKTILAALFSPTSPARMPTDEALREARAQQQQRRRRHSRSSKQPSMFTHKAKVGPGDIVVFEYVIAVDLGLSNLSATGHAAAISTPEVHIMERVCVEPPPIPMERRVSQAVALSIMSPRDPPQLARTRTRPSQAGKTTQRLSVSHGSSAPAATPPGAPALREDSEFAEFHGAIDPTIFRSLSTAAMGTHYHAPCASVSGRAAASSVDYASSSSSSSLQDEDGSSEEDDDNDNNGGEEWESVDLQPRRSLGGGVPPLTPRPEPRRSKSDDRTFILQ